MRNTEDFIKLAKAMALSFGETCEVVVHSREMAIVHIENGYISGRSVGHVMDPALCDYYVNRGRETGGVVVRITRKEDGTLLKSTTVIFYDENGDYDGMFCFTRDLSLINQVRNQLDTMMDVAPFEDKEVTGTNLSISDYAHLAISDIIKTVGKPSTLGSKEMKMRILEMLEDKGVFQLKDSVPQVCDMLGISQATLYNYLRDIRSRNTGFLQIKGS